VRTRVTGHDDGGTRPGVRTPGPGTQPGHGGGPLSGPEQRSSWTRSRSRTAPSTSWADCGPCCTSALDPKTHSELRRRDGSPPGCPPPRPVWAPRKPGSDNEERPTSFLARYRGTRHGHPGWAPFGGHRMPVDEGLLGGQRVDGLPNHSEQRLPERHRGTRRARPPQTPTAGRNADRGQRAEAPRRRNVSSGTTSSRTGRNAEDEARERSRKCQDHGRSPLLKPVSVAWPRCARLLPCIHAG
jgi:hypothetical protein